MLVHQVVQNRQTGQPGLLLRVNSMPSSAVQKSKRDIVTLAVDVFPYLEVVQSLDFLNICVLALNQLDASEG